MKRLFIVLAALTLVAATPEETVTELEANGYYIEAGTAATTQVVSDAVFDARADGGRLYMVILDDDPPGGATTFADSVLDELGSGYVVVVTSQTVGYAADGSEWTREQMDVAVEASLDGRSDDEVIQIFVETLTGSSPSQPPAEAGGGGFSIWWIVLIGGALFAAWWLYTNRQNSQKVAKRIDQVKDVARQKLDEVANDILEMEDEIATTANVEAKEHYQRASAMYAKAMEDTERATTVAGMLEVSSELDLAIWELDCAEAVLDGKPKPPRPEPPAPEPVATPAPTTPAPTTPPQQTVPSPGSFDRRPQRQSTGSQDMMTMLLTMMAMGGMRGGGGSGSWTGGRGGAPRPPMGGGGRFRGGGRRRG